MEFGTRVRGTYDVVSPPDLIALRWDFEDDNVPVPGGETPGYLRFYGTGVETCQVEVQQLVDGEEQARFMEAAWAMVLGRCKVGVVSASDPAATVAARPSRPKRNTQVSP